MQHRKMKTEQTVRTEGLSRAGKPGSKKLTKPLTFVGMIHVKIIHRCDQDPADADAAVALLDLRSDPIKHERESSSSSSGSPPNALWVEFPAFRKDTLMEDEQKPQICPEKEPLPRLFLSKLLPLDTRLLQRPVLTFTGKRTFNLASKSRQEVKTYNLINWRREANLT